MSRWTFLAILLVAVSTPVGATLVFEQPPDPAGGVIVSSWYPPDGTDYDQWVYDSFQLAATAPITEVHWRGGYQYSGYGPVTDFEITFYESIAGGSQPHCGLPGEADPYLATYVVGGTAGQTPAGIFGGVQMYDYHYTLPQPFQAQGGVKYWVRIEGYCAGLPFWGVAVGTGGNNQHFRYITGAHMFSFGVHDAAFSLHTTSGPTYQITTSTTPAGTGTTTGDGAYPVGSQATVIATPNSGYGFVQWTENGVTVSNSPNYTFTVNANRDLLAHFTTAYTVTTSAQPSLGGTTTGDGVFNAGTSVTVHATANSLYHFVNWTEFGAPVSGNPDYTFTATANRTLTANFALNANTVLFDFDNATVGTSLPIDLTSGGIGAHFTATGSGYSVQLAGVLGFTPLGFAGNILYPNSVFAADLMVDFSTPLTDFSIMYSPQELGCDDSATMRVTAYLNGVYAGTNTATAPAPGTWPTGTLTCHIAAGFDRVVVHYDSHPPTCQDWGPIFMADNMIVTSVPSSSVPFVPEARVQLAAAPNPFRHTTTICFSLAETGPVSAAIYDLQGRCVRSLAEAVVMEAGFHELPWDGGDDAGREPANGLYLCRVQAEGEVRTVRVLRLRP